MKKYIVWLTLVVGISPLMGQVEDDWLVDDKRNTNRQDIARYLLLIAGIAAVGTASYYGIKYLLNKGKFPGKGKKLGDNVKEVKLQNGVILYQSLAPAINGKNRNYTHSFTVNKRVSNRPFITRALWDVIEISCDGTVHTFDKKYVDVQLWSSYSNHVDLGKTKWAASWNAREVFASVDTALAAEYHIDKSKKTEHKHGIQPHEILGLRKEMTDEEAGQIGTLIISMGVESQLRTTGLEPALSTYLHSEDIKRHFPNLKEVYILPTPLAIESYNELAEVAARDGTDHVAGIFHKTC